LAPNSLTPFVFVGMLRAMSIESKTISVGVIGVGTMGQHHARVFSEIPEADFVGVYDPDAVRAAEVAGRFGGRVFERLEGLLGAVQAVSIAAPTTLHWDIGRQCMEKGLHVMMEKPLAHSLRLSEGLVDLAAEKGVTLMVGHIERYNPAVVAMMELLQSEQEPVLSIDARRLTPFDGSRCLDVDVLYDLLIHDMDLALEIADSEIASVSAVGRPVYSGKADITHARVIFESGTVASFTTAKCTAKKMRSLTVVTPSRFFEADTLNRTLTVFRAHDLPDLESGACYMGDIRCENVKLPDFEPLRRELEDFLSAIQRGTEPIVGGGRGVKALQGVDAVADALR